MNRPRRRRHNRNRREDRRARVAAGSLFAELPVSVPGTVEIRQSFERANLTASFEELYREQERAWCARHGLTVEQLSARAKIAALVAAQMG